MNNSGLIIYELHNVLYNVIIYKISFILMLQVRQIEFLSENSCFFCEMSKKMGEDIVMEIYLFLVHQIKSLWYIHAK